MTLNRTYRLLCPIARALDRLGDRWALLVLRDLHAGPARFGELQEGLSGIASNLLASRLEEMQAQGLIRKAEGPHQVVLYELTSLGQHTANVLYELAAFGSRLPPDAQLRDPGNRRAIAVTLKVACSRVVPPELTLEFELRIDGECFTLHAAGGRVNVQAGPSRAPQVVIETDYESLVDVTDGVLAPVEFSERLRVTETEPGATVAALGLLASAVAQIAQNAPGADAVADLENRRRTRRGAKPRATKPTTR
jgi:DNA-binding HxlR family transcriptional regulator